MTQVSRSEYRLIASMARNKAAEKKAKREAKRATLPWGKRQAETTKTLARTERKVLIAKLDELYSLVVRRRDAKITGGKCFLGCGKPIQCVAHLITRAKFSVRWDLRNGTGQDHGCNLRHEYDPQIYTNWWIHKYGQAAYDQLVRDSNVIHKWTNDDLRAKLAELKAEMGVLE